MKLFTNLRLSNERRWILYDWANSVFAVSVVSGFFPLLFRKYWAQSLESEQITLYLGLTNSILSFSLFFLLPFLGYLIDEKIKKPQNLLFITACLGGLLTSSLFFISQGKYIQALIYYGLSFLLFALGNTQYDGLLYKVASQKNLKHLEKLSSWGFLFGYLGGGIGLLLQSLLIIFHRPLGFDSPLLPSKIAFLSTAVWWVVFSIPLLKLKLKSKLNTVRNEEKKHEEEKPSRFFLEALDFLKSLDKKTLLFLGAFFLYIDVIYTTYKMAADFGLAIGLTQNQLIAALLYVQIIAVPGTYLMLLVAQKFGTKSSLYFGLFCYGLVIVLSPLTHNPTMFFVLATFIGLAQGGIQSLSRSYFSSLIKKDKQGLGFGFLNVFGKLSAVLGPTIMGLTAHILKNHSLSVLSLFPFLILGSVMLHLSFKEEV